MKCQYDQFVHTPITSKSSVPCSVTSKKSPNVYQSEPKNDFTRKMKDFDTFEKMSKNVGNLGKIIVDSGFEKLPKVQ